MLPKEILEQNKGKIETNNNGKEKEYIAERFLHRNLIKRTLNKKEDILLCHIDLNREDAFLRYIMCRTS